VRSLCGNFTLAHEVAPALELRFHLRAQLGRRFPLRGAASRCERGEVVRFGENLTRGLIQARHNRLRQTGRADQKQTMRRVLQDGQTSRHLQE